MTSYTPKTYASGDTLPATDMTALNAAVGSLATESVAVVPRARIGTGTPAAGMYVDGGTGAWTALPTGGGGGSDPTAVKLTGDQTVAGVKTFTDAPVVPDSAFTVGKISGLQAALDGKAPAASPTFTGTVTVPDGSFTIAKTTGLQTALDGRVPTSRTVTAGTGLTGGGDLAADRTLTVTYGSTAGTAAQGNDPRLSDARVPTGHAATHAAGGADELALSAAQITTGLLGLERAPAGTVAHTATTTRPTARTDIMVIFTGPTDPGAADASLNRAVMRATPGLVAVLDKYPRVRKGGGSISECVSWLDTALRDLSLHGDHNTVEYA